ncbi:hypothetical protein CTAYLR_003800 [Chrysophaeum taylorii]|uniref:Acetyl-coenzyme A transporter 1 n=1 Tax=Chrysophaeum taylorii TaxID=2483200 RepID=A0AAD7UDS3_9STRA|nr:hypothetical protein CTAYLR_003800 [Chrysophaeum taylorii]
MGLSGAVPLLLAGRVNYKGQALFSLASLPFSLKLVWAPIVDSSKVRGFGRRKSWLVPTQLLIGTSMVLARSSIDAWMTLPDMRKLTALFLGLYFLCATQDIAVDGWALTMLSEKNVGWGPTSNSLGQSLGFALSYVGFVALHDEATCNKYFRAVPAEGGLVSLADFVGWCGWAFLATTTVVAFTPEIDAEEPERISVAYARAARTLRLGPMRALCVLLLTCRAAFGAADAATALKAIDYGLRKEDVAFLSPVLLAASVVFPLVCARWTTRTPLRAFLVAVPLRLLLNPVTWAVLEYVKRGRPNHFAAFAILSLSKEFAANLMFVSQMSFFARISDPLYGGTFMTLLNTVANLGAKWPPSLALFLLDPLSKRVQDAFKLELFVSTIVGFVWLLWATPRLKRLDSLPLARWRPKLYLKKNGDNSSESSNGNHDH